MSQYLLEYLKVKSMTVRQHQPICIIRKIRNFVCAPIDALHIIGKVGRPFVFAGIEPGHSDR